MYNLIGSAKLNGLDPEAHLRYVLATVADQPINLTGELLPWNVMRSVPATAARPVVMTFLAYAMVANSRI